MPRENVRAEARPIVFGGGTVRFFQMGRNDEAGVRSLEQTEEDERTSTVNARIMPSSIPHSTRASTPGANGDPRAGGKYCNNLR